MISVFELFKVGIGPSSSHTMGPMRAAWNFISTLQSQGKLDATTHVRATLRGSLAWTGVGHGSGRAVVLGFAGALPDQLEPDQAEQILATAMQTKRLSLGGVHNIPFSIEDDILYDKDTPTPVHPNTMVFYAYDQTEALLHSESWFSIGGGFVVPEQGGFSAPEEEKNVPYPFDSGRTLLELGQKHQLSLDEIVRANEYALRPAAEVDAYLDRILDVMMGAIDRGMATDGVLPGSLKVTRRAASLRQKLERDTGLNALAPHEKMDWVSLFAMAVNEENAAGGRIVTAPTNGAAGVVPAVLRYYRDFCPGASPENMRRFLLVATAIGGLFKQNASISGAEVGCQGEVGVAASMAAAGLAAALGCSNEQIENAAEIAMEHHLGMTCDPIGGLVQIPCIERNAFGAGKAISAASLARRGDGTHRVSLDHVIAAMRQTGLDMMTKYKETSQGGLALNFVEC